MHADLNDRTPAWDDAPSYDDVMRAYPAEARARAILGRVLLCVVNAERRLDCALDRETRADQGLGAAAMSLARRFSIAEACSTRRGSRSDRS